MRHNRKEVIERTMKEYQQLDQLISTFSDKDWSRLLLRPEGKDPWTVKDAVAHITHWKADIACSARGLRRPAVERGLTTNEANHLVYAWWYNRSPQEVLEGHRQVQMEVLKALRQAPDDWINSKERKKEWLYEVDRLSAYYPRK